MSTAYIYKIRRKSDGLFSGGSMNPRFAKNGKSWSSIGNIKAHLKYTKDDESISSKWFWGKYQDCEVVAYSVIETHVGDVKDFRDNGELHLSITTELEHLKEIMEGE